MEHARHSFARPGSGASARRRLAAATAAALLVGFLAGCTGPTTPAPSAAPSVTTATTPAPSPSASVSDPVAPRPVTTGAGIPSAQALGDAALNAAGPGWVLTLFDTGSYDASHDPAYGDRILYLIAPDGTRYEAGRFTADQRADLVAWNVAQDKVLMRMDEFSLAVFDVRTNVLGAAFLPCGTHYLDIRVQPRSDGAWRVRGACVGAQVDGIYADDGSAVSDASFEASPFGTWATDVVGTAVVYSYDSHEFVATAAPGDMPMPMTLPPAASSCDPIGNGRGATVLASCSTPAGISTWELDATGGSPVQVATPAQIDSFAANFAGSGGGSGVTDIAKNCVVGNAEILVVRADSKAAAIAGGDALQPVWLHAPVQVATNCWGAHGTTGLFSSLGSLWTYDVNSGAAVLMIDVDAVTTTTPQIGTGETWSLIAP